MVIFSMQLVLLISRPIYQNILEDAILPSYSFDKWDFFPYFVQQAVYEILFKTIPCCIHLSVFGCLCFAWSTNEQRPPKFDIILLASYFLVKKQKKKGHCVCDIENQKVFISQDVQFYYDSILSIAFDTSDENFISNFYTFFA